MHIISTDENQVFAAVQEWNQNDTYNLYISDTRGIYFTLALENLKTTRGLEGNIMIDFYEVCVHKEICIRWVQCFPLKNTFTTLQIRFLIRNALAKIHCFAEETPYGKRIGTNSIFQCFIEHSIIIHMILWDNVETGLPWKYTE